MEFVVIAKYRGRPGEGDRVETALRAMVEPTRAEPGNLDYQVFRDPAQPAVLMLFERYTGVAAFAAHRASPYALGGGYDSSANTAYAIGAK